MRTDTFDEVLKRMDAEVFVKKTGKIHPPVGQLLSVERRISVCTGEITYNNKAEQKLLDRLFWDNVNHVYGTGFFDDSPQWTANIFIPMRVWETILYPYIAFYTEHNPEFKAYDFAFITAALSAWRYTLPIFKIEEDIMKRLLGDPEGRYIDGYLLRYFNQWTTFVQTQNVVLNEKPIWGFFVHQNEILFNNELTKILIMVINYEGDAVVPVDRSEFLKSSDPWAEFIVFKYEYDKVSDIGSNIIHTNIKIDEKTLMVIGKLFSLFNFTMHPKTDIYNYLGQLSCPPYHSTIDSFLRSYRENRAKPIRRGVGKLPSSSNRRETFYHVHAPSNPRILDAGSNFAFNSRMHSISKLAVSDFEDIHWKKSNTGLKLIQSQLYSDKDKSSLLQAINKYFYIPKS